MSTECHRLSEDSFAQQKPCKSARKLVISQTTTIHTRVPKMQRIIGAVRRNRIYCSVGSGNNNNNGLILIKLSCHTRGRGREEGGEARRGKARRLNILSCIIEMPHAAVNSIEMRCCCTVESCSKHMCHATYPPSPSSSRPCSLSQQQPDMPTVCPAVLLTAGRPASGRARTLSSRRRLSRQPSSSSTMLHNARETRRQTRSRVAEAEAGAGPGPGPGG